MTTLVTADEVATALEEYFNETQMEIFTDFPADSATISEGVYVARFYQESRAKSVISCMGLNMYDVKDRLEMYLITGQNNPYVDDYLELVSSFIDDALFEKYSPREYSVDQVYENSSERYRIIFSLTRQQITS